MVIEVFSSQEAASRKLVDRVLAHMRQKKDLCLGYPTGETPLRFYQLLVELFQQGKIDLSQTQSFNLDEYVGLSPSHPNSFRAYMKKFLFSQVNCPESSCYFLRGDAADLQVECDLYETLLQEKGPIDLQILGLGQDGHIGFNEPGTSFESRTHVQVLTELTRRDNSRFFLSLNEVPTQALTMGLATIMQAKEIHLMAFGAHKAQAVHDMLEKEPRISCPASVLQRHKKVYVYLDSLSSAQLSKGL